MDDRIDDLRAAVVVPVRPGPLVRLESLVRERDEVDVALDEVFGDDDGRGPGVADAVLVAGGAAAVVVAQIAAWPTIATVAGAAAVALGAILPGRALLRRLGAARRRRRRRVRSLVGDGLVLRTDHPAVASLVAAHDHLLDIAGRLAPSARSRVVDVAHAAAREVASLLDGRPPTSSAEVDYVSERLHALSALADTLADPRVGDGEHERRRALVEARREVERLAGGSSVTDAAELSSDLLGDDRA